MHAITSLIANADHYRRFSGIFTFEIAGGNVKPAAVKSGRAVHHAAGPHRRVRAKIEGPLLHAIGADGMDDALQVSHVDAVWRYGRPSKKGRPRGVGPFLFALGQVDGMELAGGGA